LNFTAVNQAVAKAQDLFDLAQPSFIRMDTGEDKLRVSRVSQSDSGLIWVATGGGLFHYDGYDYKQMDYFNSEGLSVNQQYMVAVVPGVAGVMWAGSNGKGLIRVDERKQEFKVFQHDSNDPHSIANDQINDLLESDANGVWLATTGGLDYFDDASSKFHHHRLSDQAGQNVQGLSWSRDGSLLVGTNNGLYRYDIETHETLALTDNSGFNLDGKFVSTITQDDMGRVWIGTYYSGAYLLNTDGSLRKLEDYDRVLSIKVLGDEIWMTTINSGIAVFDYQTGLFKRSYTGDKHRPMLLSGNGFSTLFVDQSGIVWVGSWGGSLWIVTPSSKFSRNLFYSPSKKIPSYKDDVSGVIETNSGEIWVSSYTRGLDIIDPVKGFQYQVTTSDNSLLDLPSNRVKSLFKSSDGSIWVSTFDAGLHRYQKNELDLTPGKEQTNQWTGVKCQIEAKEDKQINVAQYLQNSNGTMFFSGSSGLFRFDNPSQATCSLTVIQLETTYTPRSIIELDQEKTLITEYTGLHVLNRGESKATRIKMVVEGVKTGNEPQITGGNGLPSGRIFLSSTSDLYQVKSYKAGVLGLEKVHSNAAGSWLEGEDQYGNAWGLRSYWLAGRDSIKSLKAADGLINEGGTSSQHLQTSNGLYIVAQQLGLNIRKTLAFKEWNYQPPMIVTNITIDDQPYPRGKKFIIVEPVNQDFSVSFAALDYSDSQSLSYRYFLEGYSTGWISANASQRRATFTNLAPGEYVFRLQSTNRQGEWSDLELELPVTVLPSWYQTWIFRAAMLVLFIAFLYAFYLWRLGYYRAKKVELEGLVRDRTADLAQSMENLKSTQEKLIVSEKQASLGRLVSGVAHEINTPLGIARMACSTAESSVAELFQAFSINTIQDKPVLSRYKKYIASTGLIDSSLSRLSNLVDSFKKISVNEDEWRFQWFELDELLSIMLVVQQEEAQAKNVQIKLEVEEGLKIFSCREIIQNVAAELTNNALTHGFATKQSGTVTIRAYLETDEANIPRFFILQVEDDGGGVDAKLVQTVFDPFTAAQPSNLGLGLHVVVNLVSSVLHGDIICGNNNTAGSCFTARLPVVEPSTTA